MESKRNKLSPVFVDKLLFLREAYLLGLCDLAWKWTVYFENMCLYYDWLSSYLYQSSKINTYENVTHLWQPVATYTWDHKSQVLDPYFCIQRSPYYEELGSIFQTQSLEVPFKLEWRSDPAGSPWNGQSLLGSVIMALWSWFSYMNLMNSNCLWSLIITLHTMN